MKKDAQVAYTDKGYRCDAEIGTPGKWRICGKNAVVAIGRDFGGEMHYCKSHYDHIDGRGFKKAAFAKPKPIGAAL